MLRAAWSRVEHMNIFRTTIEQFFGPSHNDRFASLLMSLASTAVDCAAHFRKTGGQDLAGVIDFEHKGDAIVDDIHELLDNSFILRFDIPDSMRLTDDLDNVIDGMRKVAIHIDIYKAFLGKLRPDAVELVAIGERMVGQVHGLVAMLSESRLSLARVRDAASAIDAGESEADDIVARAERSLVVEFSPAGANRLEFLAWQKLYSLLEQVTDDANHCAKLILSLARKEA
jgi:uncharacterized protein